MFSKNLQGVRKKLLIIILLLLLLLLIIIIIINIIVILCIKTIANKEASLKGEWEIC